METLNKIKNNKEKTTKFIKEFETLLLEGNKYGIELSGISEKIKSAIETINDEKLKVALVGGFSEGKTTLVASWLGKVEESMKIDPDESSDSIQIYRPEGFEKNCEIVDTPGLYGNKTLDFGEKYKEITLKYISEAHLILFVLDPVNPIKDSHAETIKWLFRDLKKIDSVIFVLNKMDEVADLTDDEDFNYIYEIKKQNIIKTLDRLIDLTDKEKGSIRIQAVSANPKGKGLEFWFSRMSDYVKRSHINSLREETNIVLKKSESELIKKANISTINDLVITQTNATLCVINQLDNDILQRRDLLTNIEDDYQETERRVKAIREPMKNELMAFKNDLVLKIKSADLSNIEEYYAEEIGNEAINLESNISNIIDRYTSQLSGMTSSLTKSFENEIEFAESFFNKHQSLMKNGVNGLKAIPVGQWHGIINGSRHFLNKSIGTSIKFKPWGITKLAKGASGIMAGIGIAVEVWELVSTYNKNQKLEKTKSVLISLVNESVEQYQKILLDEKKYIETFVPNLKGLGDQIKEMSSSYNSVVESKDNVEKWINKINVFSKQEVEDIDYREV